MRSLGILVLAIYTFSIPPIQGQIKEIKGNDIAITFPDANGTYKGKNATGMFPACGTEQKFEGKYKNVLGSISMPDPSFPGGFQTFGGAVKQQPSDANGGKWEMNFAPLSDATGYICRVQTMDPKDMPGSVTFHVDSVNGINPECDFQVGETGHYRPCPVRVSILRPRPCASFCRGDCILVQGRVESPRHPVLGILYDPITGHSYGMSRQLGTMLPRRWQMIFEFDVDHSAPPPGNYTIRVWAHNASNYCETPIEIR